MTLSGMAALIYEVAWVRRLGEVFGSTAAAISVTLAVFFLGLGVGAWFLGRHADRRADCRKLYVLLEMILAACGLLFIPASDLLERVYDSIGPAEWAMGEALAVKGVASTFLLIIPSFAMGGTLPVLTRIAVPDTQKFAGRLGWLYGLNTVGGAVGCLGAVFILIPHLGVPGSCAAAAAANLAAALLVWVRGGEASGTESPADARGGVTTSGFTPLPSRLLLFAAALSGFLSVGLEVLWTRALASRFLSSIYSFSVILFVYLVSLGCGAMLLSLARKKTWIRPSTLAAVMAASGLTALLSLHLLSQVPQTSSHASPWTEGFVALQWREFGQALLIMVAPVMLFGLNFPLIAALNHRDPKRIGSELGNVYLANTLGAVAAPLIVGFFILPWIGLRTSIVALGLLAILFVYALIIPRLSAKPGYIRIVSGLLLAFAILGVATLPSDLRVWRQAAGDQLVDYREGVAASVAVVRQQDGDLVLKVNNQYKLGSASTEFAQGRQGLLPLMLHPAAKEVLFLGVGTGGSAGPVAALGSVAVDAVEILSDLKNLLPYFQQINRDLLSRAESDSDVRIIWGDARHYVKTTARRYGCAIGDLFIPWRAGEGSMYYFEHLESIRDALTPEGIFVQWIPLYQMDLEELRIVTATFCAVFPEAAIWWLYFNTDQPAIGLVGSRQSLAPSRQAMEAFLDQSGPGELFEASGLTDPREVLGSWIAGRPGLLSFSEGAPIETRDRPRVEFQAPLGYFRSSTDRTTANIEAMLELAKTAEEQQPEWLDAQSARYRRGILSYFDAQIARQQAQFERAATLLSASLARTPDFAWLAFNLEQVVQQSIERKEWNAVREGAEALRHTSRWRPAGSYYLAIAEMNAGDRSRARALAEEALRSSPHYAPARELLDHLTE